MLTEAEKVRQDLKRERVDILPVGGKTSVVVDPAYASAVHFFSSGEAEAKRGKSGKRATRPAYMSTMEDRVLVASRQTNGFIGALDEKLSSAWSSTNVRCLILWTDTCVSS